MPKAKRSVWYPYDAGSERLVRSLIDFLGSKEAPKKLTAIKGVVKDFTKIAKSRL